MFLLVFHNFAEASWIKAILLIASPELFPKVDEKKIDIKFI